MGDSDFKATSEMYLGRTVGCEPTGFHHGTGDPTWRLDQLKAAFDETHELIPNALWAFKRERDSIVAVTFVTFLMSNMDGSELEVMHMLSTWGPSGGLREARHSYWGPDGNGYVFYMNFEHVRAALSYLERFFDGD
jgi:hypothetical protein